VSDPPRPLTRDTLLDAEALEPLAHAPSLPPAPEALSSSPSDGPHGAPSEDDPDTLVSRSPDAQGTLGATPLVYVLVHVLDRRFSGTLTVHREDQGPALLVLDDGAVVRVDGYEPAPGTRLGDEAILSGACSEAQLASALARAERERTRLGLELVSQAGVTPEMIKCLLCIQAAKRVAELVNLPPDTRYALHLGERAREPYEPWAPLDVILAAVRTWADRPRIHGTMRFIGNRSLALHPDADLAGLATLPAETAALDAMRAGPVTLEALYRSSSGGLSSLIYVLAVTRQFAFSQDKGPPMGRPFAVAQQATRPAQPQAPSAPALGTKPSPAEADALPLATPYELEQSSPHAVVVTVLERPITESFAIADTSPGAFVKRTTAPYPIEPGSRSANVPHLSPPAGPAIPPITPPQASAAPPPEARRRTTPPSPPASTAPPAPVGPGQEDYEIAQLALAKRDYKTAESHAGRAMNAAPKNPDFAALFAWVCAHGGDESCIPEGVRALTRVVEEHPKCESALYLRGMLLKRAGKEKAALRDFVMVLYQNPTHPQALVEVRELRKGKK
jgi:hypothetical protein